ncbi:MAG: hypothetical protein R2729_05575 [Bryobacteraceae bacterium]
MQANDHKQLLYVGDSDLEFRQLADILSHSLWSLQRAIDCAQAAEILGREAVPVVLASGQVDEDSWAGLLERAGAAPPNLIVCSLNDAESVRMARQKAFDVLDTPFDETQVLRRLDVAEWDWNRRHRFAAPKE